MACPLVTTGQHFLASVLDHIDCQATTLGSFGFQALAQPGGLGQALLTGLLTLMIAILAIRLMMGRAPASGDAIGIALRVGIALTLVASWPAFRTVLYDTVLHGPAELAAALRAGDNLPGTSGGLTARLQAVDDAIVALTAQGTGREVYAPVQEGGTTFKAIALEDQPALGWARVAYLVGTLGPLVALRLASGLLLALTPIVAGLLLLGSTRGLFAGWARGLVLCLLGSLGLTVVYASELAILEPWVVSALQLRGANYATPAAPTELLVLTLSFAIAALVLVGLLARVAFHQGWPNLSIDLSETIDRVRTRSNEARLLPLARGVHGTAGSSGMPPRLADQRAGDAAPSSARVPVLIGRERGTDGGATRPDTPSTASQTPLGGSYRRAARRTSGAGQRRDTRR